MIESHPSGLTPEVWSQGGCSISAARLKYNMTAEESPT